MSYRLIASVLLSFSFAGVSLAADIPQDPKNIAMLCLAKGIKDNDTSTMDKALTLGADVHSYIQGGLHPFAFALQANSNNNVLNWLLDHGVELNKILARMDFTPLTLAVSMARVGVVQHFLSKPEIDVNVPNAFGRNALALSVVFCRSLSVSLLAKGSDPLRKDRVGDTPWSLAVRSEVPCPIPGSREMGKKRVPCDREIISKMLEVKRECANVEFQYVIPMALGNNPKELNLREDHVTAMHVAAATGNVELIRLLYNADKTSLDAVSQTFKLTPLMVAIATRQENALDVFLALKAKVDVVDKEGWNPIMHAVAAGLPGAIGSLRSAGATFDVITLKEVEGQPTIFPLRLAIVWRKEDVALRMIELGAPYDKVDSDNLLPIMSAVDNGMPSVVQALLNQGADANSVCSNGLHVLLHAAFTPDIEDKARIAIYDMLVKAGATKDGMNPEYVNGLNEWEGAVKKAASSSVTE